MYIFRAIFYHLNGFYYPLDNHANFNLSLQAQGLFSEGWKETPNYPE